MSRRKKTALPAEIAARLDRIRTQLELAAVAVEESARTLEVLATDETPDVAFILRRAVVSVLREQADSLDVLLRSPGRAARTRLQ